MDAIFSRPNPAVGTVLRVMGLASFRSRDLAHKADTSIHGFTGQLILDEACYVIRCRLGDTPPRTYTLGRPCCRHLGT
jgi:hypothetical protein